MTMKAGNLMSIIRGFFKGSLRVFAVAALTSGLLFSSAHGADKVPVVAVATLMDHPALNAVETGLKEELARRGLTDGKGIRYIPFNANGQIQFVATIANQIVARNPDVIVAITTPMAQAVAKVAKAPVVFGAVTDPVGAGLVKSIEHGEPTITGTSDAWPYQDQLKLIREITPLVRRLGVLFNPGEAPSQYGMKKIREFAKPLGFEVVDGPVNSTTEVYPVAQSLSGRVDALFLSSDNTVISGMAGAMKVAIERKIPLYVGDSGTVKKGGLAAVSVGYHDLGQRTGELVARVLAGERGIPTVVASGTEIYLNAKAAELMGVELPQLVIGRATGVYQDIE